KLCQEEGIADIMSLTGIPGSVGGLVKMNAGIPSREIKDVVRNITIITKEGEQQTLSREHLDFEYRSLKLPRTHFILSVLFRFRDLSSPEDALAIMRQHQEARVSKQPLEFPSLGSVFKNPQPLHRKDIATPAGKLIEEAGLKNIRIGGARISPKHANFIINENEAKASDVLSLISLIKDKVKQISQIELETEIRILGEEACC
ncbi:MAG TPA: UDP-N-acetylmuramate dehydrogenase, partial [bacterium]|nr:UDP-N-acetylmuramate dehydrogenase [bacterium]